jgi:DNA helicase HerA-like ATPase
VSDFQLPKNDERVAIVGHTGSGKTQQGAWLLSHYDFEAMPFVIIDFKYDDLLNSIENINRIDLDDTIKKPGLYIVHPMPGEEEQVEKFLWKLWARENVGIYTDEGYMIDKNSKAFQSLLTQGRSKHIPMITLSQRPAFLSLFVFTEASHFSIFHLTDVEDEKRVQRFMREPIDERLPQYWSRWYNVAQNKIFHLQPVPNRESILERFNAKIVPKRRFFT